MMSVTAQLMLEGMYSNDELASKIRIQQASMIIQACSELSAVNVLDLMAMCKTIAVGMGKDFTKFERIHNGADILNKIFQDDKSGNSND